MDQREIGDKLDGPGLEFLWAIRRTRLGKNETFATRSQRFIKRQGFAVTVFLARLVGEPAKLFWIACEALRPRCFIVQRIDDLRSDGVLFLFRKSSHFAQGFFEHFSHGERLANGGGARNMEGGFRSSVFSRQF